MISMLCSLQATDCHCAITKIYFSQTRIQNSVWTLEMYAAGNFLYTFISRLNHHSYCPLKQKATLFRTTFKA